MRRPWLFSGTAAGPMTRSGPVRRRPAILRLTGNPGVRISYPRKDYASWGEAVSHAWRALVLEERIEVPGEILAGGLQPHGPITEEHLARIATKWGPRPTDVAP